MCAHTECVCARVSVLIRDVPVCVLEKQAICVGRDRHARGSDCRAGSTELEEEKEEEDEDKEEEGEKEE